MNKIFFLLIALGFFSSSAASLEINNYDTAKMTYFEELDEFANNLSPSELIQAINSLQVRQDDCSTELFMVLRQQLLNFAIQKKIGKKAHLTSKLFKQEEGCRKAGLFKHYKRKSSTGAFLHWLPTNGDNIPKKLKLQRLLHPNKDAET